MDSDSSSAEDAMFEDARIRQNAVRHAIESYHELNPCVVDEFTGEPSALEFMRYVARNTPFVARKAAQDWNAYKNWDSAYLCAAMEGKNVKVAITPTGNADAVVYTSSGGRCFVEPYEIFEHFSDFLNYVRADSDSASTDSRDRVVRYAQTQNDNFREEYISLFPDVPPEIAFARIALEKEADAINLWVGNDRSVTSLHKDHYENVYIQIRGQKHFVLLSPIEMPCTNEQPLHRARYSLLDESATIEPANLIIVNSEGPDNCDGEDGSRPPFPVWDPDKPDEERTKYSDLSVPLRVTLNEGDMLYLPALWYHKVKQTSGEEGFACSVNYWYDMDFTGGFATANEFLREVAAGT